MRRLVLIAAIASSSPAVAIGFQIDAAGGYWFTGSPQVQLRLGVHHRLTEFSSRTSLSLALRSGFFIHTAGTRLGIPLDLALELRFAPVFFGVVSGVWFHFNDGDVLRAHVGGEFGVYVARHLRLSVEVSWLQPSPLLLGRLGVVF